MKTIAQYNRVLSAVQCEGRAIINIRSVIEKDQIGFSIHRFKMNRKVQKIICRRSSTQSPAGSDSREKDEQFTSIKYLRSFCHFQLLLEVTMKPFYKLNCKIIETVFLNCST